MSGLTDTMKRAVFETDEYKVGDMCLVEVTDASPNTLFCKPMQLMNISDYHRLFSRDRYIKF